MGGFVSTFLYAGGAAAMAAIGGGIGASRPPSPKVRSYVQHAAAGLVFSSVTVELLPDVVHRGRPVDAAVGFALGVVAMLMLRYLTRRLTGGQAGNSDQEKVSWSLVGTIFADVLIDGIILGVLFTASHSGGQTVGVLVALGLAAELFSLGLATSGDMAKANWSKWWAALTATGVGLSLLGGTAIGSTLLGGIAGAWLEGTLAFGAAILMYLVTEELLVEAHRVPQTPIGTSLFFAGFLLLLMIDIFLKSTSG